MLRPVMACPAEASGCRGCLPEEEELSTEIQRECTTVRAEAADLEEFFDSVSLDHGDFHVVRRIGVSSSRPQGHYGVNSAVFEADFKGQRCALKGIICAYGPFKKTQGSLLNEAVRDELRQPPPSPHLLRYWRQFDAVVRGDVLQDWPLDVQTTPRGSLTKWFVMPLLSEGNLQTWVRTHPLDSEVTLLALIVQILKGVAVLVQHKLLHRDLKLDNVLVQTTPEDASPRLMIADFGCMICMDDVDGPVIGNPQHTAPELRGPSVQSDLRKAEVWASGVLCFDIADIDPPYDEGDDRTLHAACVSQPVVDVIEGMFDWEHSSRPTALQAAAKLQELRDAHCALKESPFTLPSTDRSQRLQHQCHLSEASPVAASVAGGGLPFGAHSSEISTQTSAPLGASSYAPPMSGGASSLRRAPGATALPGLASVQSSGNSRALGCSSGGWPVSDRDAPPSPDTSAARLRSSLSQRRLRFQAQELDIASVADDRSGESALRRVTSTQVLGATPPPPSRNGGARSDLALDVRPSPDASVPRLGSSLSARRLRFGSRSCADSAAAGSSQHMGPAENRTVPLHVQDVVPPSPKPSVNRLGASLSASRLRFLSQSPAVAEVSLAMTAPSTPESRSTGAPVLDVAKTVSSGVVLDQQNSRSDVPKSPAASPSRLRPSLSERRLRFSPQELSAERSIDSNHMASHAQRAGQQQACVLSSAAFLAEVPPLPFLATSARTLT